MSFAIKIVQTSEGPKFVTVYPPDHDQWTSWFQHPWAITRYYHINESWSGGVEQALTKEDRT